MTAGETGISRFSAPAAASVLAIAACLLATTARSDQHEPVESTPAQINLFGIAPEAQASFFQRNRCLAGRVTGIETTPGGLKATIVYPSANYGPGDLRATVIYSHRVEILESGHPEGKLDGLDLERSALVLAAVPGREFVYRLVGVVALPQGSQGLQWDFFADKPRFWFNGRERDD